MNWNFKLGLGIFLAITSMIPFSFLNSQAELEYSNCETAHGELTDISKRRKGVVDLELSDNKQNYLIPSGYMKFVNWKAFETHIRPGNMIKITYLNSSGFLDFTRDRRIVGLEHKDIKILSLDDIRNGMDHLYQQNLTIGLALSIGGFLLAFNGLRMKITNSR